MTNTPDTQDQPTTPAPTLPYTFKGNIADYRRRLGVARPILGFALSLIILFRFGVWPWLGAIALILLVIAVTFVTLSRRTVTLSADELVYYKGFGRKRTVKVSDIEGVKVFAYVDLSFGAMPRVSIGVKNGAPIIFTGMYWALDDMDKLLAHFKEAKVATEYYKEPATYSMIAKQFPAYASYAERHTWALAFTIVGVLIVGIVAALLIIRALD